MEHFTNPNDDLRISDTTQVGLHFSVSLENGVEIDNTRQRPEPVRLTIGDGNLLPGFEQALLGLRVGDRRTVMLSPEEGFGQWNPANVQVMQTIRFTERPQIGQVVEFTDQSGATLPGVIRAVSDELTEVDFNHPLSGQNIIFEVEIFEVLPAGSGRIQLQ